MVRLCLALVVVALVAAEAHADVPTIAHQGHRYVELGRLAEHLEAQAEAPGDAVVAYVRGGGKVVTLARDWARVLVDARAVVLEAPVRVHEGTWLVPQGFVEFVGPRLRAARTSGLSLPPRPPRRPPSPAPTAPRAPLPAAVALQELRYRSYPSFTRVVLETSAPVDHQVEASDERELRVRIAALRGAPRAEPIGDGLVGEVRLERAGADALLRVRFDGGAGQLKVSSLADPPRLVLDFVRPEAPAARERETLAPLRTIVLDAGHGGHDTGARGASGLLEKDLVLDVTKRVTQLLEDQLDVRILLTRSSDTFVTLQDRTSFANRERADLFVSIHANAHRHRGSDGVETYFLSSEATDSAARQVAAAENDVVQLEKPQARRGRDDLVRTILWDLAQSEFQLESSRLAEIVQDSITKSLRTPNRGVKQAGFYVLGGAAMPAILIEIGFLTNPKEERRLKDPRYRDEIARAIFAGLAEYKRHWDARARGSDRAAVDRGVKR